MKTYILALSTFFAAQLSYSQTATPAKTPQGAPGYVVSTAGDTLFGEINYMKKSGYRQSMQIKFPDQTTKMCNARNFVYVKAGDEVFESLSIANSEGKEEKQFFWKKTGGKIAFYEYQYELYQLNTMVTKSEFYIKVKGSDELVKISASNFKKKLEDLVKDNPKIAERIASKDTKFEEVEEILKEYNKG